MVLPKRSRTSHITAAQNAILTTVAYGDIFNFPLTKSEIWQFLIAKEQISYTAFQAALLSKNKLLAKKEKYYFLTGREALVTKRMNNLTEVESKMQRASMVAAKLAHIPTILFIGISGSLSAKNVTSSDDIDLFFIVKKDTVYLSRFCILLVLQSLHLRRKPKMEDAADTICANLLIDETALCWPESQRNLYTAREIAQIVPVFDRGNISTLFLQANSWIRSFLPNAKPLQILPQEKYRKTKSLFVVFIVLLAAMRLEGFLRMLQMIYMKPRRTIEYVTRHHLAFHPVDYKTKTLTQLRLKMRHLGLLTIF